MPSDPIYLIDEVYEVATGKIVEAAPLLVGFHGEVIRRRLTISDAFHDREQEPPYLCPVCRQPVGIRQHRKRKRGEGDDDPETPLRFHFWHFRRNTSCALDRTSKIGQAERIAAKYWARRESKDHYDLKHSLAESLRRDPRFGNVVVEATWSLKKGPALEWRRPDVSATFEGRTLAFEVQLSPIQLKALSQRRVFYRTTEMFLVWMVRSFDPYDARLADEDIFYPNNHNIFLLDEDTLKGSVEQTAFKPTVVWEVPQRGVTGRVEYDVKSQAVDFEELTFDPIDRQVFYFDTLAERRKLTAPPPVRLSAWRASSALDEGDPDRWPGGDERANPTEAFAWYWKRYRLKHSIGLFDSLVVFDKWATYWTEVRHRLRARGIEAPSHDSQEFQVLLDVVYAGLDPAHLGTAWSGRTPGQLVRYLWTHHPNLLWIYRQAVATADRLTALRNDPDFKAWWAVSSKNFQLAIATDDSRFKTPTYVSPMLAELVPSLTDALQQDPKVVWLSQAKLRE